VKNIIFTIPKIDLDLAGELLLAWGVLAVTIQNSARNNSPENNWFDEPQEKRWDAWEEPVIIIMVDTNIKAKFFAKKLKLAFNLSTLPTFFEEKIKEINWTKETQKFNRPNKISERLWILPSIESPVERNVTNVFLNPGSAFGTGSHPTTRLCLEWLSKNIKGGESLLDYGCGSGILAIAGKKLGCSSSIGVDIDPNALNVTKNNSLINNLSISVYLPEELSNTKKFDIIIANILYKPLIELLPRFKSSLKPGGLIAVSGILESQIKIIKESYSKNFTNISLKENNGWALVSGIKLN